MSSSPEGQQEQKLKGIAAEELRAFGKSVRVLEKQILDRKLLGRNALHQQAFSASAQVLYRVIDLYGQHITFQTINALWDGLSSMWGGGISSEINALYTALLTDPQIRKALDELTHAIVLEAKFPENPPTANEEKADAVLQALQNLVQLAKESKLFQQPENSKEKHLAAIKKFPRIPSKFFSIFLPSLLEPFKAAFPLIMEGWETKEPTYWLAQYGSLEDYKLCPMPSANREGKALALEKKKIYIKISEKGILYKVMGPDEKEKEGFIVYARLKRLSSPPPASVDELMPHFSDILDLLLDRGHTKQPQKGSIYVKLKNDAIQYALNNGKSVCLGTVDCKALKIDKIGELLRYQPYLRLLNAIAKKGHLTAKAVEVAKKAKQLECELKQREELLNLFFKPLEKVGNYWISLLKQCIDEKNPFLPKEALEVINTFLAVYVKVENEIFSHNFILNTLLQDFIAPYREAIPKFKEDVHKKVVAWRKAFAEQKAIVEETAKEHAIEVSELDAKIIIPKLSQKKNLLSKIEELKSNIPRLEAQEEELSKLAEQEKKLLASAQDRLPVLHIDWQMLALSNLITIPDDARKFKVAFAIDCKSEFYQCYQTGLAGLPSPVALKKNNHELKNFIRINRYRLTQDMEKYEKKLEQARKTANQYFTNKKENLEKNKPTNPSQQYVYLTQAIKEVQDWHADCLRLIEAEYSELTQETCHEVVQQAFSQSKYLRELTAEQKQAKKTVLKQASEAVKNYIEALTAELAPSPIADLKEEKPNTAFERLKRLEEEIKIENAKLIRLNGLKGEILENLTRRLEQFRDVLTLINININVYASNASEELMINQRINEQEKNVDALQQAYKYACLNQIQELADCQKNIATSLANFEKKRADKHFWQDGFEWVIFGLIYLLTLTLVELKTEKAMIHEKIEEVNTFFKNYVKQFQGTESQVKNPNDAYQLLIGVLHNHEAAFSEDITLDSASGKGSPVKSSTFLPTSDVSLRYQLQAVEKVAEEFSPQKMKLISASQG